MPQEKPPTLKKLAAIRAAWQVFSVAVRLRLNWISADSLEQLLIRKRSEPMVCMICSCMLEVRHGYCPAVGRIAKRAYELDPNDSWLVYNYVSSLHKEERYDEIRNVNILPCLDGEDDGSKYVRQMHHYSEQRYKENQHDGF